MVNVLGAAVVSVLGIEYTIEQLKIYLYRLTLNKSIYNKHILIHFPLYEKGRLRVRILIHGIQSDVHVMKIEFPTVAMF